MVAIATPPVSWRWLCCLCGVAHVRHHHAQSESNPSPFRVQSAGLCPPLERHRVFAWWRPSHLSMERCMLETISSIVGCAARAAVARTSRCVAWSCVLSFVARLAVFVWLVVWGAFDSALSRLVFVTTRVARPHCSWPCEGRRMRGGNPAQLRSILRRARVFVCARPISLDTAPTRQREHPPAVRVAPMESVAHGVWHDGTHTYRTACHVHMPSSHRACA